MVTIKKSKFFLILMSLFLIIIVSGCSNESTTKGNTNELTNGNDSIMNTLEINVNLTDLIVSRKYNSTSEAISKQSFIDLYHLYKNQYLNYDLFECSKKETDGIYIAGYISNSTIDLLDSLEIIKPLGMSWYISGVDEYLGLYQNAIYNNLINSDEHPIVYRFCDVNQLKLIDKDVKLVVVLEKQIYKAERLDGSDVSAIEVYLNTKGKIKDNLYILEDKNKDELSLFLMACEELKNAYTMNELKYLIVLIEEYNNVKGIFEECNLILSHSNYEEYFEIISKLIISPNKVLERDMLLVYDYDKIKKLIQGGF